MTSPEKCAARPPAKARDRLESGMMRRKSSVPLRTNQPSVTQRPDSAPHPAPGLPVRIDSWGWQDLDDTLETAKEAVKTVAKALKPAKPDGWGYGSGGPKPRRKARNPIGIAAQTVADWILEHGVTKCPTMYAAATPNAARRG